MGGLKSIKPTCLVCFNNISPLNFCQLCDTMIKKVVSSSGAGLKGVHVFSDDSRGFVNVSQAVPDVLTDIRYYSSFNFVGRRIDGYRAPLALLTREAAQALKQASLKAVSRGLRLKIFDAYRPQAAVDHFVRWASDPADTLMKPFFYPDMEKKDIIPGGYILEHSGHTRGSTVDLTLFDMKSQQDLDMGGPFDFFGPLSHPDSTLVTPAQHKNRMLLQSLMTGCGFSFLKEEWWHFTLENEPYPDTYFTFPVKPL